VGGGEAGVGESGRGWVGVGVGEKARFLVEVGKMRRVGDGL